MDQLEITPAGIVPGSLSGRRVCSMFANETTACLYLGITAEELADAVSNGDIEKIQDEDGSAAYNIIDYADKHGRPFSAAGWFAFQEEHQRVPHHLVDWGIDATMKGRYWPQAEQACLRLGIDDDTLQAMVEAGEVEKREADGCTRYDIWRFVCDDATAGDLAVLQEFKDRVKPMRHEQD